MGNASYLGSLCVLVVGLTSCGGLYRPAAVRLPGIVDRCQECLPVSGHITELGGESQRLVEPLYLAQNAHLQTDFGVEIEAPDLALNTKTGVFVLNSMNGRINRNEVEIEIPRGTLLNIESQGPARGDAKGYLMTGGASITLDGATVRASTIKLRYF